MVTLNNSQTKTNIQLAGAIQQASEKTPDNITNSVQPTIEANPMLVQEANVVRSNQAVNATSATLYTTLSNCDFYLTSCSLHVIKDVNATSTVSAIQATIDGLARNIIQIGGFTTTVQDQGLTLSFPHPIKIDRGTAIQVINGTNVANVTARAAIQGFNSQSY